MTIIQITWNKPGLFGKLVLWNSPLNFWWYNSEGSSSLKTIHVFYFPHSVQISQKCQKVYVTITTAALLTMVPRHFKNNQQDREQTADQNTELACTPVY